MMRRARVVSAFCLAAPLFFSATASAEVLTWRIGGDTRQAIVHAPEAPAAGAGLPLVLAFHGYGDDMENFQHVGLHRAWPDAVVVYVQGLPTRGGWPGWQVERGQYGDRDLRMVDEAVSALRRRYRIDERRIYATGFSNGAGFTYLLWSERPQLFAAFGPVAGRLAASVMPASRAPVLHVAGRRDTTVTFADQQNAFETAVKVNGGGAPRPCGDGCTEYGADTTSPVTVWIHEGGHSFPPGTSERITAFFRQHPSDHAAH